MGKKLKAELVFAKCKTDNFKLIKHLNLWGNDLSNVEILVNMHNLEVLSLSVNDIRELYHFSFLVKLKELYLRWESLYFLIKKEIKLKTEPSIWSQRNSPFAKVEEFTSSLVIWKSCCKESELQNLLYQKSARIDQTRWQKYFSWRKRNGSKHSQLWR